MNGTENTARHAAPDVGFDEKTNPGCIRAGWIADHPDRRLPDQIASHRQVQVAS